MEKNSFSKEAVENLGWVLSQVQGAVHELDQKETELSLTKKRAAELSDENHRLIQRVELLEKEVQTMEAELIQAEDQKKVFESCIAELEADLNTKSQEIETIKDQLRRRHHNLLKRLAETERELVTCREELGPLREQTPALKAEVANLSQRLLTGEALISEKNQELVQLQRERDELAEQSEEFEQTQAGFDSQLRIFKNQIAELTQKNENLNAELKKSQAAEAAAQQSIQLSKKQLQELLPKIQQVEKARHQLAVQLREKTELAAKQKQEFQFELERLRAKHQQLLVTATETQTKERVRTEEAETVVHRERELRLSLEQKVKTLEKRLRDQELIYSEAREAHQRELALFRGLSPRVRAEGPEL